MSTDNKIALFIDCENISCDYLDDIFNELPSHGKVISKRAYANWSKQNKYHDKLNDFGIKAVHVQQNTNSKNASDMEIAIDVMKAICEEKIVDAIAIVSSDSDFTSIAQTVTSRGIKMIGFGEKKTNISFRNACSVFIELPIKKESDDYDEKFLIGTLKDAIVSIKKDDGFAYVARIGTYLKNKNPNYISKNYGGNSWGDILKKYPEHFQIMHRGKNNAELRVKLKEFDD
ncbi:MAG: NYN domain-containing protein [Campylobacteraceae bacterium]|jgi:uncharacterized LabA/DUF88 family protein|nr:NYN domain-containing protein [Campylobacteraceae bacterium]